jgi:hypothetical protein
MLGTGDYVICLPHTPFEGAEVVAARVRAFLEDYAPLVGTASFGEDGADFEALLVTAEARLS